MVFTVLMFLTLITVGSGVKIHFDHFCLIQEHAHLVFQVVDQCSQPLVLCEEAVVFFQKLISEFTSLFTPHSPHIQSTQ